MTDKLRAGVIGVGYLGRFHAEKFAALPGVELVGVADLRPERSAQVAAALHCRAYADYRELLPMVEAVSVAATTREHYRIVKDCLTAGLHVLVEKPICAALEEARELVELARRQDRILMVGHLERFHPAMQELKSLATAPKFIESHRLAFFKERGTDVDVILDLMIHDLDHTLSLVRAPVREIRAAGVSVLTDRVDLANARLEFADGAIANLTASRMSLKSMRRFRLFQPDAYLAVDFEAGELTYAQRRPGASGLIPGVALDIRHFEKEDVLFKEIAAFVRCIREGTPPPCTGEEGAHALQLALEITQAMRKAKV
ncbi:MAG: Gfo/Idh/MocA family oxidoreductase [Syntrophobacterales bacterium]|nr:Gfo/Idh/MocA family oxidoreductase [Syntrophobacterales bacterium]